MLNIGLIIMVLSWQRICQYHFLAFGSHPNNHMETWKFRLFKHFNELRKQKRKEKNAELGSRINNNAETCQFKLPNILMIKMSCIIERRSPLFANKEQNVKASNLKWIHPLCYESPSGYQIQQLLIHYVSCTGLSHILLTALVTSLIEMLWMWW